MFSLNMVDYPMSFLSLSTRILGLGQGGHGNKGLRTGLDNCDDFQY